MPANMLRQHATECCLSDFILKWFFTFFTSRGIPNVNVSEVSFDEIHQLFSKDLDISGARRSLEA